MLPSIVMMIFTSIYGVVDGLFVSNFVGKTVFAAINLVMPFIMILGGVGFMIGTGGSALVAKTLGQQEPEDANRYFSMMIILTVLSGAVLTAIGLIFMRPISYLLGATDAMIDDCVRYGRTVLAFVIAFMLQNVFQSFLITAEKPRLGLLATVAAGVTNMALDALFIAGFKWGVVGAAVATGLSQCVGGVLPLIYFLRPNSSRLRLVKTRLELRPILKACGNGSSELMSNISGSLVSMLYNFQLLRLRGRKRRGGLRRADVRAVHLRGHFRGLRDRQRAHRGLSLRRGKSCRAAQHADQEHQADERGRRITDRAGNCAGRAAGPDLRGLRRGAV